ncbi:succinylglutamate desuccinylase/aspartoacylase family protein [Nonomuraea sp. K274]|uniref:Succinylglutamate desuccinylase/aspartoacylase family protein n=1 Tax=Nonomuraea cypriaca TaxID=1187855 RepID=A0A931EWJ6_9ACTN|nr:M14 family metallopeptidase [Nonomuraea cypriaca]MBF8185285.1 succinylglutamate desuccinylase/aspartoacylase family protein [Nonomuraea cypriaca]
MTVAQIPVTTLAGGHRLELTVHTLRGASEGPRMVMFGGIHGDEPMGSETVRRLLESIDPAQLAGTIVAVPVANPYAHQALTRNTPLDGVNLNRIFPGNRGGTVTEQLAAVLSEILEGADYFIDFHSGGNFATVEYAYIHDAGAEMSRAYGTSVLYHGHPYIGSATGWALEKGVRCMVSELGGGGQRIEDYLRKGVDGTLNVLRTVGMLPGEPVAPPEDQVIVETLTTLAPTVGGTMLSDFGVERLGERLPKGTVLAKIISPHTFEVLEEIVAPYEPSILILGREHLTNVAPGDYGFMVADGAGAKPA